MSIGHKSKLDRVARFFRLGGGMRLLLFVFHTEPGAVELCAGRVFRQLVCAGG